MYRIPVAPAFPVLLMTAVPSLAATPCNKEITTADITRCAKLDYEKADTQLNETYQAILHKVATIADEDQRKNTHDSIVTAERLWIKYRDADCNAVYNYWRDGTIRSTKYWVCMRWNTIQRIKDLDFILQTH